tara:strand:- start:3700 stop:4128 length:429 start_codon:yes stop_codon:yes gene_type:complete
MAYIIFNNANSLMNIAANDSDLNSLNIVLADNSEVSVSDTDFLKVKTGTYATYDGTNVTLIDQEFLFTNIPDLESYINKVVIEKITQFSQANMDNSLYTGLNNYKEFLENFDYSSVSFPLNISWEKYCEENSITFYHPLQIP